MIHYTADWYIENVHVAKSEKTKDNFCHPHELEYTSISLHFASWVWVFMLQGNLFQAGGQSA